MTAEKSVSGDTGQILEAREKLLSDHAETLHSFLAKDAGERLPVICLQKGPQEVFNEKINGSQERAFLSLYSFKPHAFKALTHDYQFV